MHSKNDEMILSANENPAGLDFSKLSDQSSLLAGHPKSRGLIEGAIVSLASNGIKQLIKARQKRYFAQFNAALTGLNFYNNLSTNSAIDPSGIKFNGFKVIRLLNDGHGKRDTAFIANFIMDTTNIYDIVNTSQFHLKLDRLDYRVPKVKFRHNGKVNVDFEIVVGCTYMNDEGSLFNDLVLGKFYLTLRNVPVGTSSASIYYNSIKGQNLDGTCFLVPRSFGYYISENKRLEKCFNSGSYYAFVTVTESSKSSFIEKLVFEHQSLVNNYTTEGAKQAVKFVINTRENGSKQK